MNNEQAQQLLLLGEIKGIVQGLKEGQDLQAGQLAEMRGTMKGMDDRLRVVEQKAAVIGALSGGAMSVGVALIIEGLKQALTRGGPGT